MRVFCITFLYFVREHVVGVTCFAVNLTKVNFIRHYIFACRRIKSEYEADIHELENTISGHRLKLNEARTKAQEQDDKIAELTSELNKCHNEQKRLEDVWMDKLIMPHETRDATP